MCDCKVWTTEQVEDPWTGEWTTESEWEDAPMVDIDLHRYKCTKCGNIGYYSSAAREYHEEGIKSSIKGLDK